MMDTGLMATSAVQMIRVNRGAGPTAVSNELPRYRLGDSRLLLQGIGLVSRFP